MIGLHIVWINITIVVMMMYFLYMILRVSSSLVLLSYSTLELGYSSFFKFLSHLLFLLEPGIFGLTLIVDIVMAIESHGSGFAAFDVSRFRIAWCSHIEHQIIKIICIMIMIIVTALGVVS